MKKTKSICLHAALLVLGGLCYNLLELLWRGRTHWSMFLVGGLCFELIGIIHQRWPRLRWPVRCLLCSAAVTAVEFVSGCIFNLWLGMKVWDYSRMPFHIAGQVCLLYSAFWAVLSAAVGPLYRVCRRWLTQGLEHLTLSRGNSRPGDRSRI